jgi:glucokinase
MVWHHLAFVIPHSSFSHLMSEIAKTSIGIDFGGTSVKLGVCRGDELLVTDEPIPTANFHGPAALIGEMAARVAKLRQTYPAICAIGVGVPGLVDFDHGFVHELTNVPGWKHVPLKAILSEKTGLPVLVENDANAMAYAEFRYGAARGLKNVIGLTMGTGIGGGIVLDGKMFRGSGFVAGEIGQMSIHFDGKPGHYGNLGALEKYTGNQQIAEHAVQRYAEAGIEKDIADCTPKKIAAAAQTGDDIARQIWGEVADWLGTAISSIAWLLNPDAFVIGGGVAQAGDLIFTPLKNKVQSMLSTVVWERMQILPARFSNEAGIIGNAALAADAS